LELVAPVQFEDFLQTAPAMRDQAVEDLRLSKAVITEINQNHLQDIFVKLLAVGQHQNRKLTSFLVQSLSVS
jgi:hypothetical protein